MSGARRWLTAFALLGLGFTATSSSRAGESPAQPLFEAGFLARAEGREAEAFRTLERAFEADPTGPLAADSLYYAAEVADQLAHDYPRAVPLYQHLVARFPSSRYTPRARARLGFLARSRAAGDEPLARYEEILARYATLAGDTALARMEALLADFPAFPLASAAALWIGDERRARGEREEAARAYDSVLARWPDSSEATHARKGLGDLSMAAGRWDDALAWYRATGTGAGGVAPVIVERLIEQALEQRNRSYLAYASAFFAASLFAWLLARTRWRALATPGLTSPLRELAVLAPPLGLLVIAASGRHPVIFRSIAMATTLDLALTAANALYVETRRLGHIGRAVHACMLVVAFIAILYVSCYANGLHVLLEDTLRHGPE